MQRYLAPGPRKRENRGLERDLRAAALTEERHLGSDPDYQAYRSRVCCRFFPGLV